MGVNFSSENRLMAQHVLNGFEVGAAFDKVGSEGVAEGVWTHIFFNTRKLSALLYNHEYHNTA